LTAQELSIVFKATANPVLAAKAAKHNTTCSNNHRPTTTIYHDPTHVTFTTGKISTYQYKLHATAAFEASHHVNYNSITFLAAMHYRAQTLSVQLKPTAGYLATCSSRSTADREQQ
jgi:hypothetical protein